MSDLVDVPQLATLLRLSPVQAAGQQALLGQLLDGAEALFLADAHRANAPFQDAQEGRVEIHDAPMSTMLLLDYPVDTITEVVIGLDLADPDETLDPTVPTQIIARRGSRIVMRTDGDLWDARSLRIPPFASTPPRYVRVTYDTQADLPEDAMTAILQLAAGGYHETVTGQGTIESEQLDNYSVHYSANLSTLARTASQDPRSPWALAVAQHRRVISI